MFFALWEEHASSIRGDQKTLEILCSVYFAIHPILSNQPELLGQSMDRFKQFLSKHGEWAQEPEFLQYYALPYLPDPKTHPTFRVLFDSPWLEKLKKELESFLSQISFAKIPKLIEMMESKPTMQNIERPNSQLGNEIRDLKQSIKDSTTREHDLLSKLKHIRVCRIY